MDELIENGTFHICPNKKSNLVFIYHNGWYELSFKKIEDLYEKHGISMTNERIKPGDLKDPIGYIMKYFVEGKD